MRHYTEKDKERQRQRLHEGVLSCQTCLGSFLEPSSPTQLLSQCSQIMSTADAKCDRKTSLLNSV